MPVTFRGGVGTRYVAHSTPYKQHDRDGSIKFKRVRFKTYEMMRADPGCGSLPFSDGRGRLWR